MIPWLGMIAATALAAAPPDRPNILWITIEDASPDLGCYGDDYARTPNLDRFATQGVRYTRAFSIAGVCAPSRSGIITGMFPTTIGTHHMRSKGVPPPYVKCFTEYLRAAGYYCTNNVKTDYNFDAPVTAWDENSPKAHWRNRPAGRPFFAVFNFTTTHESQIRVDDETFAARTKALAPDDRHDPAQAELPPYYPDTPVVRRDWARYHDLLTAVDLQVAGMLKQLEDDGLADETVVFFFSDHGRGLPRAKRWVYDSGIHVPLIIRWPGKLKPGTVNESLVSLIDFGPTVLSIAGVDVPDHVQGRPFLGTQAAEPREYVFAARDRMDETYDIIRCARDKRYKYIRNFKPGRPYAQYIDYMEQMPTMREMRRLNKAGRLVGAQKLFFLPEKPPEELYDTQADPHEVHNLAADPDQQERLAEMRGLLGEWMQQTNDLGLIPEEELNERVRPGGEWAVTAKPVVEPAGGRFKEPVTVTITCTTDGASIAYTTEAGERPHWELYARPIRLEKSCSLRVMACRLGYKDSAEVTRTFTIGGEARADEGVIEISVDVIDDKIRGGLLGQLLGNLNGLPHEMKYIDEPGDVKTYTPALPDGARTDDDTDIEWIYLTEMERTGELMIPYPRIAELWREHINRKIWCANAYARQLIEIGIEPPLTGRVALNPWSSFNISGQFICESFGLIAPAMPRTAARIGLHYTHVTIDGEPAQTTQLFTAMIATAFVEDDVGKIVDAGLEAVDPESEIRRIVEQVRTWHREEPKDWRATRRRMHDAYTRHGGETRDRNGYELNTAATIASLLYGGGDLVETLRLAFSFGWDADNNAATSATIVGVIRGRRWMDAEGWTIRDLYRNDTRDNMPESETITRLGDRLSALAKRCILDAGGRVIERDARSVYQIPRESPARVEPLVSAEAREAELREHLAGKIDELLSGNEVERARGAYLRVCLDDADPPSGDQPADRKTAMEELASCRDLIKHIRGAPGPDGEKLRARAAAAGLAVE